MQSSSRYNRPSRTSAVNDTGFPTLTREQKEASSKRTVRVLEKSSTETEFRSNAKRSTLTSVYGSLAQKILGLNDEQWKLMEVKDEALDGRLILVGYRDNINPPLELQELRGVPLDTKALIKVGPGSEFTEVIQLEKPELEVVEFTDAEFNDPERLSPEKRQAFLAEGRKPRTIKVFSPTLGGKVSFDVETDAVNVRNRIYSQGVNLKIFLHDGRVRVITNNNLDPSGEIHNEIWRRNWDTSSAFRGKNAEKGRENKKDKANYAHGPAFTDEFSRVLGFDVNQFYPAGCLYSPYTYSFLLTIPSLVTSTRAVFPENGYLTFIRKEGTWRRLWKQSPDLCPFKENEADANGENTFYMGVPDHKGIKPDQFFTEQKGALFVDGPVFGDPTGPSFLTYPRTNLSIEQTDQWLKYGHVPPLIPERLAYYSKILERSPDRNFIGEAIILTKRTSYINEQGLKKYSFYSVQVQPPGYAWRHNFFNSNNYQGDMYKLYLDAISVYSPMDGPTYRSLAKTYPLHNVAMKTAALIRDEETKLFQDVTVLHEEHVLYVFLDMVKQGLTFFYPLVMLPEDPLKAKPDAKYNSAATVATPYFLMLMNPMRQKDVIKYHERYTSQADLLVNYVGRYQALKREKGGPYDLTQNGINYPLTELYEFASGCWLKVKEQMPKDINSIAARDQVKKIAEKLLERENGQYKLLILDQVARKRGQLKNMKEITKVGEGEIKIPEYKPPKKRAGYAVKK